MISPPWQVSVRFGFREPCCDKTGQGSDVRKKTERIFSSAEWDGKTGSGQGEKMIARAFRGRGDGRLHKLGTGAFLGGFELERRSANRALKNNHPASSAGTKETICDA
jgi:hypothetical protein